MRQETARVIMDEQRLAEEIRLLEEEADKQRRVSRAFQLVTQLGTHKSLGFQATTPTVVSLVQGSQPLRENLENELSIFQ